mmetsp:Transcript_34161/g.85736  ORF Transcript_34161/g.85736 Transcript_34161/m.85736 type:complete len:279 (+) Transcript_34161:465-1301(+)
MSLERSPFSRSGFSGFFFVCIRRERSGPGGSFRMPLREDAICAAGCEDVDFVAVTNDSLLPSPVRSARPAYRRLPDLDWPIAEKSTRRASAEWRTARRSPSGFRTCSDVDTDDVAMPGDLISSCTAVEMVCEEMRKRSATRSVVSRMISLNDATKAGASGLAKNSRVTASTDSAKRGAAFSSVDSVSARSSAWSGMHCACRSDTTSFTRSAPAVSDIPFFARFFSAPMLLLKSQSVQCARPSATSSATSPAMKSPDEMKRLTMHSWWIHVSRATRDTE